MKATVHETIGDIEPATWNALAGDGNPFLRHEFLLAAERSGSVGPGTGWLPRHLLVERDGEPVGAMPLFEKTHSWGEFVFDWSWAQAYTQAGLDYYPKLVSAAPFTPAPGARLLLADPADSAAATTLIEAAIRLAESSGMSSVHVLFPQPSETGVLSSAGLQLRKDCQFHWHNQGYADFDEFLATFSSRKRKKVRQDRRRVANAGITFRRLRGAALDREAWLDTYRLISRTFMQRGSLPYFEFDFFTEVTATMPDNLHVVQALRDDNIIAAAVFFESRDVLYGRYWGSDGDYDALHFETCYYQGIEYCIDTGKRLFEPGTQGEHKISRGFVPVETWSAHWLAHPEFFSAIGRYLDEEHRHVDRYIDAVESHSPYRDDGGRDA